jgi:Cu(I)/Ag(I) efflux system membrane fusion protein
LKILSIKKTAMETKIKTFEDLPLWKKASAFAIEVYKISETGKMKNDFGSKDQIRRAACSISNNIAEGFEYNSNKMFIRFLKYSKGSAGEVRNQIYILSAAGYMEKETYNMMHKELIEISQQIANFIKYLRNFENKKMKAIISTKNRWVNYTKTSMFFLIIPIILIFTISCKNKKAEEDPNVFYTCSMDPQVMERKPGKCPICKMELTKTVISPNQDKEGIKLSETQIKLGNIKTQKAAYENIGEGINLRGTIVPDERKINVISSRVSGRIDKLYFRNPGEAIKAGDHIYDIYSEDLQAAVQQYLLLKEKSQKLKGEGVNYNEMLKSAKDKLIIWGLSENQINKFNQDNSSPNVPFYSKVSGIVNEVLITEGDYINEGTSILKVADYSALWIEAEAYPRHFKIIKPGLKVKVIAEDFPDEVLEGTISFENPALESRSGINLVRVEIPNKEGKYKPGMRVTVIVCFKQNKSIVLPEQAILFQPGMNTIWILNNRNAFEPRMVKTGISNNGRVEIKSGLSEGEMVVISGAYLIDSEYRLRKGSGDMQGMDH